MLCLCVFLSALDITIVSTSLNAVSNDLHAYERSSWVISSYLTSYFSFLIMWAKLSDFFGRKLMLVSAVLFMAFSGGCGGDKQFCSCMGGAGIFSMTPIIVAEMVAPENYGAYNGIISLTIAFSFLLGPLLGGAITDGTAWRWIFYINLLIGFLGLVLILLVMPAAFPDISESSSFALVPRSTSVKGKIDYPGFFLLLAACVLLIVAIEEAGIEFAWESAIVVTFLILARTTLCTFIAWQWYLDRKNSVREPVFPWTFVKNQLSWFFNLSGESENIDTACSSTLLHSIPHVKFPKELCPWPSSELRRLSINSFGFGGANAHVVMEDARNHMKLPGQGRDHAISGGRHLASVGIRHPSEKSSGPNILVFSSQDENGIERLQLAYNKHFATTSDHDTGVDYLSNLAYTLSDRRSSLLWRAFVTCVTKDDLMNGLKLSGPVKALAAPRLAFCFTRQGAQWFAMGRELYTLSVYSRSITKSSAVLKKLLCPWKLEDELSCDRGNSRVSDPEYSQVLCTVLQIALVDLLETVGIQPTVLVGHSSGEIAAAVAYYRGLLSSRLANNKHHQGRMLAAGSSATDIHPSFKFVEAKFGRLGISVGCLNSPKNLTITGEEQQIDYLGQLLDKHGVFARKLAVNVAYRSPQIKSIADKYGKAMGNLSPRDDVPCIKMVSSVTGSEVTKQEVCQKQYWVQNMISPVRFAESLKKAATLQISGTEKAVQDKIRLLFEDVLEIGPHSALQRSIKDTLGVVNKSSTAIGYVSTLVRGVNAINRVFDALGYLYCRGHAVNVRTINNLTSPTISSPTLLTRLPDYPFDHSHSYWRESREAKWRKRIKMSEEPWIEDHTIARVNILPAAAMLVMAVEAAKSASRSKAIQAISGYALKDVSFPRALAISRDPDACRGSIRVSYVDDCGLVDKALEAGKDQERHAAELAKIRESCSRAVDMGKVYKALAENGVDFGPAHQVIKACSYNDDLEAFGELDPNQWKVKRRKYNQTDFTVHPTFLNGLFHMSLVVMTKGVVAGIDKAWIAECEGLTQSEVRMLAWSKSTFTGLGNTTSTIEAFTSSGQSEKSSTPTILRPPFELKPYVDNEKFYNDLLIKLETLNKRGKLFATLARNIYAIFKGEQDALQLMFQTPLVRDYYRELILEIGAGTGGMTKYVLDTLVQTGPGEAGRGTPRFSHYTFTGISAGFFSDAKALFGRFPDKVTFSVLGIEKDPVGQGFQEGVFDLIIADNVFHATQNLDITVKHARKLLKPGGKLALFELTNPEVVRTNFAFGLLPGWWRYNDSYRTFSAGVSDSDYDDTVFHEHSALISTAKGGAADLVQPPRTLIVFDQSTSLQSEICDILSTILASSGVSDTMALPLGEAVNLADIHRWFCIVILELGKSFLWSITETQYQNLKVVLQAGGGILYFIRVAGRPVDDCEQEYVEKDGNLCIDRFVEADYLNQELERLMADKQSSESHFGDHESLALSITSPGLLNSLEFVEYDTTRSELEPDALEIKVEVGGVNFRDCLIALGRIAGDSFGFECAGTVCHKGCDVRDFKIGDRVSACTLGAYQTYTRCKEGDAILLPDAMTFLEAATMPVAFTTTLYALAHVANIQKSESILIHSAAGRWHGTGRNSNRSALWGRDLRDYHIFDSRNNSFAMGVRRMTAGKGGVDVILNSLSCDLLVESWQCIALFGRFIELGKKDILTNSDLPKRPFSKTALFHAIDLHEARKCRPALLQQLRNDIQNLLAERKIAPPQPIHVYGIGEVEKAFRYLRSRMNTGKTVVEMRLDDLVKTNLKVQRGWHFDKNATYIIAGGLGSLGRSTAWWMATRGTKNLVLFSRSRAINDEARKLIDSLKELGTRVETPACDISSYDSLKEALDSISRSLPPIKGCIQSAMVLRVSLLSLSADPHITSGN
ncbi:hypothetical protein BBP40_006628 [Aspergillus hancockii]|nr:hypothetical protein BBP40_006628 [Aspergillus hancockii]